MTTNESYSAVSLFTIPPDEPLPFAVCVYYKGNFIVYRQPGEVFEVAKYNRFIYKRIAKLYIRESDLASYKDFVRKRQASEEQKLDDPKLTVEQKVSARAIHNIEAVTQELFVSGDEQLGEAASKVVEVAKDTVQRICERPYLRIFESIPHSSSIVSHSMRVSLLATFLGYQLGFVNPLALEHLAAAGMLHDIGKTRLANPNEGELDGDEFDEELEKKHPLLSVEVLKKSPLVPEEVVHIVLEHHERRDGTGFPNGIKGRQMHGLSKVFQIANTFDNLTSALSGDRDTRYKQATETMEKEMRAWFDPMLLPKALKLLGASG